jgi:hypothetical protein
LRGGRQRPWQELLQRDDEVFAGHGLHREGGLTNTEPKRDFQRHDRSDDGHRACAAQQQHRPAPLRTLIQIGVLSHIRRGGERVGVLIRQGAVRDVLLARVCTGGDAVNTQIARCHRVRVDLCRA